MSNDLLLIAIIAVCVLFIGLIMWLVFARGVGGSQRASGRHRAERRPHRDAFRRDGEAAEPPRKRAAIIVNPTKFDDLEGVRRMLTETSERLGWDAPKVLLTTEDDPGTGQARTAVTEGYDVVCPLGGDGTIRAVATALVGTDTPMGLLPRGTGNLLARNLAVPFDRLEGALEVAYTGKNRRVDVGWVTLDEEGEQRSKGDPGADPGRHRHIFLVMAGLGIDAAIMSGTSEAAKAKVGWPAYVATGLKNIGGPGFKVRVKVGLDPDITRRTRSVIIGNCGKLTGGITLMPDARIDDGILDTVILSPKGIVGWGAVAAQVLTRRRKGHERLDRHTGERVVVTTDDLEEVELDGDIVGSARRVEAWVDPLALTVRVEATSGAGGEPPVSTASYSTPATGARTATARRPAQ